MANRTTSRPIRIVNDAPCCDLGSTISPKVCIFVTGGVNSWRTNIHILSKPDVYRLQLVEIH